MLKRWGLHLVLFKGMSFKVKLLYFKKGGAISYQKHQHRAELWCWIFGEGAFKLGENQFFMRHKGETLMVPKGEWHQYIAKKPTLILEVQHGGMCKENDIERRF